MTEQPRNESVDEADEPTRTWAPSAEPVTEAGQPVTDPVVVDEAPEQASPTDGAAEPQDGLVDAPVADTPAAPDAAPAPEATEATPEVTEPIAAAEPVQQPAAQPVWPSAPAAAEPTRPLAEPTLAQPVAEPTRTIPEPEYELDATAPAIPVVAPAPAAPTYEAPAPAPTQAIFRDSPTQAIPDPSTEPLSEEAQKLAAERAARKEARDAALAATAPVPVVAPEPVVIKERTNDKFFGSLGIFLLRLVVAGIFAIRGYQMLGDLAATQQQFGQTLLAPYAAILAMVTGIVHLLIALSLLLGLLTRVAGLGVLLTAGGALALVWWGPWSPFVAGQPGFLGELELLLATTGLLLLLIGGGGWSIDRSFRSARAKDKAARQLAA